MDYAALQVGRKGSLPPSTKVLHGTNEKFSSMKMKNYTLDYCANLFVHLLL